MTPKFTTPEMMRRASELRHNQTEAEARLCSNLRAHRMDDVHFRRQYVIGNFIVDFCAPRKKLIIELDGSQHLEKKNMIPSELLFLRPEVIGFCGFGIMM